MDERTNGRTVSFPARENGAEGERKRERGDLLFFTAMRLTSKDSTINGESSFSRAEEMNTSIDFLTFPRR